MQEFSITKFPSIKYADKRPKSARDYCIHSNTCLSLNQTPTVIFSPQNILQDFHSLHAVVQCVHFSHTTPSPQWQHHQIEEASIGKTISAPECKMSHHHFLCVPRELLSLKYHWVYFTKCRFSWAKKWSKTLNSDFWDHRDTSLAFCC